MNITKTYLVVTISNFVIFSWLYTSFPDIRGNLISEDQFIENLTAIIFFCCTSLSLFFLFKYKKFYKRYIAVMFISLIAFLDEISFGKRIFNFQELDVLGFKADGVHDIIIIIRSVLSRQLLALRLQMQDSHYHLIVLLIKASLLLGAFLIILFLIIKSKFILSLCEKYLPFRFILGAIFFLVMSQAIDTLELGYKFLILMEELSEMNLALSLLFVCFSLSYPVLDKDKVSRRLSW